MYLAFQAWDRRQQALAIAVLEEQEAEEKIRAGEVPHPLGVEHDGHTNCLRSRDALTVCAHGPMSACT